MFVYENFSKFILKLLDREHDNYIEKMMPELISLAQFDIKDRLKNFSSIVYLRGTLLPGNCFIDKPLRWSQTLMLHLKIKKDPPPLLIEYDYRPLDPRPEDYIKRYLTDNQTQSVPEFYSEYSQTQWHIAPTPDKAYEFEVKYSELYPTLDSSHQENKLLEFQPHLLTAATLYYANLALKNFDVADVWLNKLMQSIEINNQRSLENLSDATENLAKL